MKTSLEEERRKYDEARKRSKECKHSYANDVKRIIDSVFDEQGIKCMYNWLLGRPDGLIRFDPLPSKEHIDAERRIAEKGYDAYKLHVRGTLDNYEYLTWRLNDFYGKLYNDLTDIDFWKDKIIWEFDSISLDDVVFMAKNGTVDDIKAILEDEIYDKFVYKYSRSDSNAQPTD